MILTFSWNGESKQVSQNFTSNYIKDNQKVKVVNEINK